MAITKTTKNALKKVRNLLLLVALTIAVVSGLFGALIFKLAS